MTEHPAQTLHRAAEKLRGLAQAAIAAEKEYLARIGRPEADVDERYRATVYNLLGGAAGVLASTLTPSAMLLLADWLDEAAETYAAVLPDCFPKRPLDLALAILEENS